MKQTCKYIFLFNIFAIIVLLKFNPTFANKISNIQENEWVMGYINAPITMIEYASLSCVHCANFHQETLPKLIKEYVDTNKIKIVFRDFPLNYPALMASMVLQCITQEIRYEYLSALFILQSKWAKPEHDIVKKELFKIFQTGGMTKDQFNKCLDNKDIEQKILQGLVDAQNEYNLSTTPSFLINDTLLEGNKSFMNFKEIIDNYLANIE